MPLTSSTVYWISLPYSYLGKFSSLPVQLPLLSALTTTVSLGVPLSALMLNVTEATGASPIHVLLTVKVTVSFSALTSGTLKFIDSAFGVGVKVVSPFAGWNLPSFQLSLSFTLYFTESSSPLPNVIPSIVSTLLLYFETSFPIISLSPSSAFPSLVPVIVKLPS